PENLAILYPLPTEPPVIAAVLSGAGIALMLYASWRARERAPYVLVGSLWFLGTLVPVSGIVQLGKAVSADRFTYVPQIGFFIAVVWGISALVQQRPRIMRQVALIGTAAVIFLSLRSFAYIQHWKDSVSIFSEAASATEGNAIAHGNAGYELARRGALTAAVSHYEASLAISPMNAEVRSNFGVALSRLGNEGEAIEQFKRALADDPSSFGARLNLATHSLKNNKAAEAISYLEELAKADEEPYLVHYWLGRAWAHSGQRDKAITHYQIALESALDNAQAAEVVVQLRQVSGGGASVESAATP
ncbi:MAG: tetratricopeptide repeat protein, partial [Verrucomicrobiaceae bacterium]